MSAYSAGHSFLLFLTALLAGSTSISITCPQTSPRAVLYMLFVVSLLFNNSDLCCYCIICLWCVVVIVMLCVVLFVVVFVRCYVSLCCFVFVVFSWPDQSWHTGTELLLLGWHYLSNATCLILSWVPLYIRPDSALGHSWTVSRPPWPLIQKNCLNVALFGRHYLSKVICLMRPSSYYALFRRVKEHHDALHSSPLLKRACVRQVMLDKWFPPGQGPNFNVTKRQHKEETIKKVQTLSFELHCVFSLCLKQQGSWPVYV